MNRRRPSVPTPQVKPPKKKPRLDWADLLRRVFALDVLVCPYNNHHRVLAFITGATVVRAILQHLGLPSSPLPRASAQSPPQFEFLA